MDPLLGLALNFFTRAKLWVYCHAP